MGVLFSRLVVLLTLVALLMGCSSDAEPTTEPTPGPGPSTTAPPSTTTPPTPMPTPTPTPTPTPVEPGIGPAGGTVSTPSGAAIVVPPGALAKPVVLTATPVTVTEDKLGAIPMGAGIAAGPEGQTFLVPIEIRLPYDPKLLPPGVAESSIAIRMAPAGSNAYTWLGSTVDTNAHVVVAKTTHFTNFVPAVPPPNGVPPLLITTTTLPDGKVGTAYNATFASTGGTAPVTWSLSPGATLPAGLALATSGVLSGTPTTAGPAAFFVSASDSAGQTVQSAFGFTVNPASPVPTQNPSITTVTPASATVGAGPVTLTLVGTRYLPTSRVFFGGIALTTTYVSATQLTASVPASALILGDHAVSIVNDALGTVVSTIKVFTVTPVAPIPTITSISPATLPANGVATQITITGTSFTNGVSATVLNQGITTTYKTPTSLTAIVPGSYLSQPGTLSILVYSPTAGFSKASVKMNVGTPATLPTLTTLSTKTAFAGSTVVVGISGTNFVAGAELAFGTALVPVTVTSATSATATLDAALLAEVGTFEVRFVNPSPSGTSTALVFAVHPPAIPWSRLDAGIGGTCGLSTTNQLYCWGSNPGAGTLKDVYPRLQAGGMAFDAISAAVHVCGLSTGKLYCWGRSNDEGQTGIVSDTPVELFAGKTFTAVSSGRSQSCALAAGNELWCWGKGYGDPGAATNHVAGNFIDVSSSQDLVVALDNIGTVQCGGLNAGACNGLTGSYTRVTGNFHMACGLDAAGQAFCTGEGSSCYLGGGSSPVPFGTKVQLPLPGGVSFVDIQAGCFSSCGLASNGDVYCWGRNASGILGNGTTTGTAWVPTKVPNLPPATSITMSKGNEFVCALTAAGERYCWGGGGNSYGQVGVGTWGTTVTVPTQGP